MPACACGLQAQFTGLPVDWFRVLSFKEYNQAAIIELIVRAMPEIAGQISAPLAKTEKMVIISSGNGPGGGASKLTSDVTTILSQLPPVLEALTGVKFETLMEKIPGLKNAVESKEKKTG